MLYSHQCRGACFIISFQCHFRQIVLLIRRKYRHISQMYIPCNPQRAPATSRLVFPVCPADKCRMLPGGQVNHVKGRWRGVAPGRGVIPRTSSSIKAAPSKVCTRAESFCRPTRLRRKLRRPSNRLSSGVRRAGTRRDAGNLGPESTLVSNSADPARGAVRAMMRGAGAACRCGGTSV